MTIKIKLRIHSFNYQMTSMKAIVKFQSLMIKKIKSRILYTKPNNQIIPLFRFKNNNNNNEKTISIKKIHDFFIILN